MTGLVGCGEGILVADDKLAVFADGDAHGRHRAMTLCSHFKVTMYTHFYVCVYVCVCVCVCVCV